MTSPVKQGQLKKEPQITHPALKFIGTFTALLNCTQPKRNEEVGKSYWGNMDGRTVTS